MELIEMKFQVINLGCKVNAYEAESVAALLEERGWTRIEDESACDAVLIFTCAVTNTAAQKSRQMLHRAKRSNPNAVTAAVGCYAELDAEAMPEADIIVGSQNKHRIPDYIEQVQRDHQRIIRISDLSRPVEFEPLKMDHFEDQTRAYLKIQDGCNQFCSYCIIPYARGRERSMAPEAAIQEAVRLSQSHHEIVLAGIHTGRYGREYGVSLAQLMKRMLASAEQLQRLRVSSIEMSELDEEFLELFASEPRIARHLHIPLQSGCDSVLKRMNRPYDTQAYYDKINLIRRLVPEVSISADLIVGFPQETEEEFESTLAFVEKCQLSFLHVFPYSMRKGTPAAEMSGQIPNDIKKQRAARMIERSHQLYDAYMDQWIGRNAEVLIESESEEESQGHASQYFPIRLNERAARGELVDVHITGREQHVLIAESAKK
jgi:threonylcarbamoyladenosine tRNA methylthiotransferase MtaB